MKKLYYFIILFLALFVAFFYFTTTPYFFHKYIAPNIKSYHFSYKGVKGTLFNGFKIEHLSYKNKELSSFVELQFNPFALLEKKVLVNKLTLKDVNKEVLKELINDFKSKSNSSTNEESSSFIALDFVLRNIDITFQPFEFNSLQVYKNRLSLKELSFMNGKISLDKNYYYYDTNFGLLEFEGTFKKGVLYIDKIAMRDFDLFKSVQFLQNLESNSSNQKQAQEQVLFLPKKVIIKDLFASLKPFEYKKIAITQAKLQGENIELDLLKKKLYKAMLNVDIVSSISDFSTKLILKDKKLTIPSIEIALLNSNALLAFFDSFSSENKEENNNSISFLDYIVMQEVTIKNMDLLLKQLNLSSKEYIKRATLSAKSISFHLLSKRLQLDSSKLVLDSSLASIELRASIQNEIAIQKLNITSTNANKIVQFIQEFNTTQDSNTTFIDILPSKLSIKQAFIDLKDLDFNPYRIKKATLDIQAALFDLNKALLQKAKISLYNDANWGKAILEGNIKKNIFFAKGEANITQKLLDQYDIPLRAQNMKPISVEGYFSLDDLNLTASLAGKDILKNIEGVSIDSSSNRVYYNYHNNKTIWDIKAFLSHPFLKATLSNHLQFIDDKFSYYGLLKAQDDLGVSKTLTEFLKGLQLSFKGDSEGIDLLLQTNTLKGKLFAKAYQKGILELQNRKVVDISKLLSLKQAKLKKLLIKAPVDFRDLSKLSGSLVVDATLMKLKGKWSYNKALALKGAILDSQIVAKKINKKLLFPIDVDLLIEDTITLNLSNTLLKSSLLYNIKDKKINLKAKSNALTIDANGDNKELMITIASSSLGKTLKEIQRLYPFNLTSKIDGRVEASIKTDFNSYDIQAQSKAIQIGAQKKPTTIENITIKALYRNKKLMINNYQCSFQGFKLFASSPSELLFQNDKVVLKKFIINNTVFVTGEYNTQNQKGKLLLKAKAFAFENQDYDIKTNLDLKITTLANRYMIAGVVDIIKATIKKNLERSNGVDSDDIIILQKEAQKKSSFYVKNIQLDLKVKSQKGVLYAQDGSYFIAYPRLKITKRLNRFTQLEGTILLDKKSFYIFKGKKLRLKRGKITFKGKSSLAYLNIVMYYKGRDYDIYITITGDSSRPVVYFSSNPPLTKEQILAYLLFNDTAAAGTHSQESMLNLVGGALAQSFFGSIGLKIDKLSIKENGFSIGKALNDKVIIYYNQEGETPSIKTRIDITNSIHSVIEVGEGKQSADIIFSKEY